MIQNGNQNKKLAFFLRVIKSNPVFACLGPDESLEAVKGAETSAVIIQHGTLQTLPDLVQEIQLHNKFALVEVDRLEGLKADASGLQFLKGHHVDAAITTRTNVLGASSSAGLIAILRCFVVDRKSRDKAVDLAQNQRPDLLEVLPATAAAEVCRRLEQQKVEVPLIASGLLTTSQQVQAALAAGASAVSTSQRQLWKQPGDK